MFLRPTLSLALLCAGSSAFAQAAPAADQPLGGPAISGVCLLSRDALFANAAVGKAAIARLQDLSRAAQTELEAQRGPIQTELKALEGQPDNAATKAKRDALAVRAQNWQRQTAHTGQEIEATRTKALERIVTEAKPVIAQVYTARKCGLLLDRSIVMGGNLANDLTADVVKGLDAKIQTIPFERERLPQGPLDPNR
jgi:Skp family chaperone for outer membrane proteins